MPYLIEDIRSAVPQSGFRYLFDANVWLAVLEPNYNHPTYRPYVNFFNSIISETHVWDASIVIPSLLLSEIINRISRDIFYEEFKRDNTPLPGQEKGHFKKAYKKSHQYSNDMETICASIRAYHRKIEFISDNLDKYSCKDLIKKIPTDLDFNDYLYSKMAIESGLVIITNDSDFKVEDVTILTSHPDLLGLS